ncbi:MAG TPA: ketohydroxyglutarate aldolase, partial [Chroococcidiopsis sp.]
QAGAASVKVFPVQAVGGSAYIHSLQGPLGGIPLIPTGGVTLENAHEFVQAGAIAIGLASELFPKAAMAAGNWAEVTERAQRLLQNLKKT